MEDVECNRKSEITKLEKLKIIINETIQKIQKEDTKRKEENIRRMQSKKHELKSKSSNLDKYDHNFLREKVDTILSKDCLKPFSDNNFENQSTHSISKLPDCPFKKKSNNFNLTLLDCSYKTKFENSIPIDVVENLNTLREISKKTESIFSNIDSTLQNTSNLIRPQHYSSDHKEVHFENHESGDEHIEEKEKLSNAQFFKVETNFSAANPIPYIFSAEIVLDSNSKKRGELNLDFNICLPTSNLEESVKLQNSQNEFKCEFNSSMLLKRKNETDIHQETKALQTESNLKENEIKKLNDDSEKILVPYNIDTSIWKKLTPHLSNLFKFMSKDHKKSLEPIETYSESLDAFVTMNPLNFLDSDQKSDKKNFEKRYKYFKKNNGIKYTKKTLQFLLSLRDELNFSLNDTNTFDHFPSNRTIKQLKMPEKFQDTIFIKSNAFCCPNNVFLFPKHIQMLFYLKFNLETMNPGIYLNDHYILLANNFSFDIEKKCFFFSKYNYPIKENIIPQLRGHSFSSVNLDDQFSFNVCLEEKFDKTKLNSNDYEISSLSSEEKVEFYRRYNEKYKNSNVFSSCVKSRFFTLIINFPIISTNYYCDYDILNSKNKIYQIYICRKKKK